MPNFNTHWLVAIKCIESSDKLLDDIKIGFNKYKSITKGYKKQLTATINSVIDSKMYKTFVSSDDEYSLNELFLNYNKELTNPENHDVITIFSAYMLGACGPDFWTVTSPKQDTFFNTWLYPKPDSAGVHFDLGHYNRSHQQFVVAINRWRDMKKKLSDFQVKVEQAYFYGMATHIATDCVIHQLVNVSAGAYHLLKKDNWYDEDRKVPHVPLPPLKLWNTHNKVEHYWDSYIRYRYLGDINPVFGEFLETDPVMTPLGFPTAEKYIADLVKELEKLRKISIMTYTNEEIKVYYEKITAKEKMLVSLRDERIKLKIEKPFILPRIFCDRVLNGQIAPFLYDIIVNKDTGSYEKDIIFPKAIEESKSYQMQDTNGQLNEKKKLAFFSSAFNGKTNWRGISYNYLNYCVCPDLDRLKLYGWDQFYHTEALKPFVLSAMKVGNAFIRDLIVGISSKPRSRDVFLGRLGKFWNLDTGLGLEVRNLPSDTRHEVITELNFIHVTEAVQQSDINYRRDDFPWYLIKKDVTAYNENQQEVRAFKTYKGGPFKSRKTIFEDASNLNSHRYLDRINLHPKEGNTHYSDCKIDHFFIDAQKMKKSPQPVATQKNLKSGNVLQAVDIFHRLTLNMRVPVAEITDHENLGFYLHNDSHPFFSENNKSPDDWFKSATVIEFKKTKNKDHTYGQFKRQDGLCVFNARILMNMEKKHLFKREIEKGKWNNAIGHNPDYNNPHSRNFSVSTGRENVLIPCSGGKFNGKSDFKKYRDISPTEQIFFTLYMLVQSKDGCYDMLSKKHLDEDKLKEIKKIDALGFVKIVLFYQLTHEGAMQVKECLIDGLPVQVKLMGR